MRDGDKLYRIVADETSLGDWGENCVWTLPPADDDDNYFRQTVYLRNDSLTIVGQSKGQPVPLIAFLISAAASAAVIRV